MITPPALVSRAPAIARGHPHPHSGAQSLATTKSTSYNNDVADAPFSSCRARRHSLKPQFDADFVGIADDVGSALLASVHSHLLNACLCSCHSGKLNNSTCRASLALADLCDRGEASLAARHAFTARLVGPAPEREVLACITVRLWRSDFTAGGVAALKASIAPGPPAAKSERPCASPPPAGRTCGRPGATGRSPPSRRDQARDLCAANCVQIEHN